MGHVLLWYNQNPVYVGHAGDLGSTVKEKGINVAILGANGRHWRALSAVGDMASTGVFRASKRGAGRKPLKAP